MARIDRFIVEYRKELENMTQERFMENLVGLAKNKLLMSSSLSDECDGFWAEITDYRYDWQVKLNEILALRRMTKEDVMTKYDEWLMPTCSKGKTKQRRAIAVQVIGAQDGPSSIGRPLVDTSDASAFIEDEISAFHKLAGDATWGKIL